MEEKLKRISGSEELKKIIDLFKYKRKLGLSKSGFSNPLLVIGESGIGKSQIIEQYANENQMSFIKFDLSNVDSTTFNGLMITVKEEGKNPVHYHTIPNFIDKLNKLSIQGKEVLIFLDEINRTNFETRNAVFKLVINNEWGIDSKKLNENVYIIAAMNPNNENYGDTEELDTAFNKRFVKVLYEPEISDWISYGLKNGIHSLVIEIIEDNPHFFKHNDNENKEGLDPRSWEDLSFAYHVVDTQFNSDKKILLEVTEMYAPYIFEKLRFFIENRKEFLSLKDLDKELKNQKDKIKYIKSDLKSIYEKLSIPRKLEILNQCINMLYKKEISSITYLSILLLSPTEILMGVFSKVLNNPENKKNKYILEVTEKIEAEYNLNIFEKLSNSF